MTDNAKCAGVDCDLRDGCNRFVRPAVDGQRWLQPRWADVFDFAGIAGFVRCLDMAPILPDPIEPHGGAPEEGDAC